MNSAFHFAFVRLTTSIVLNPLLTIRKSCLSFLFSDMNINDDPNEDHLASYDIQLCIQESIEASQAVVHPER